MLCPDPQHATPSSVKGHENHSPQQVIWPTCLHRRDHERGRVRIWPRVGARQYSGPHMPQDKVLVLERSPEGGNSAGAVALLHWQGGEDQWALLATTVDILYLSPRNPKTKAPGKSCSYQAEDVGIVDAD